ncbi:hypothetical protein NONO_c18090 [Nocardia nova SH22a]|uniref:Uncharacterized protein n=2 Tax=Nocardia nova TaxID=37330 RepID=W5TBR3_9NOCA|nr:hypothetical protein NONO_c18090 [Nocardia nova SH22a]
MLLAAAAFLAAVVIVGAVGAIVLARTSSDTSAAPVPTTTRAPALSTAPAAPIAPTTTTAAAGCQPAPFGVLVTINNALTSPGVLTETAMVTDPAGRQWIGGNITHNGTRLSSADVWVVNGGIIYALSGGARGNSTLHDGRHLLNLSAGDEAGIAVQDCVTGR